jgi:hypothetical protein
MLEINIVNKLVLITFVIGALTAPALSFAQPPAGLTRAQVVAELARLEKAGYNPSMGEDSRYPVDIQAAEARVAAEDAALMAAGMNAGPGISAPTTAPR